MTTFARGVTLGRCLLAAAMCLLFVACDPSVSSAPTPGAACTTIGSQCQLPDGPLGVCQEIPCASGTPRPCFKCTSQH